ncbi:hypothetical protein SAPIO_CDS4694 [Scedosporium apiospermum]|uniref:Uncharacterized protein n=1 Tax=Pseudallescheria apiosperma TaxID=563466 RepID=A0A084G829_PSEDA|nr:uncharacterized protein SAPIO_CDS4694 [Scedosporium apiospermum]KEZ43491.1 hypothetical protein SAPIO_CDS4694 [Scedosporium apiospermum]
MDSNTRQTFPFLELPYFIRHDIYILALDYPDLDPIFARIQKQNYAGDYEHTETKKLPISVRPTPHVPAELKTTPGIMLCSRQTAWEAQQVWRYKTFTLKRPPAGTATLARPMDITEFISEDMLKRMRQVHFIMNLWGNPRAWLKTVEMLLDIWSVETHLKRIDITLEQPHQLPPGEFWPRDSRRYVAYMLSMIRSFAEVAGIELIGTPPLPELPVQKWPRD